MSIREANAVKTQRRCLKCGRVMWTDRCHRLCTKCGHTNERLLETRASVTQELRQLLRQLGGVGGGHQALGGLMFCED
ncbi:MAG: hypothetical protein ACLF0G_08735 [Candidatus Brocadiia bacterium]